MGKRDKQKQKQKHHRGSARGSFYYLQEQPDIDDSVPRLSPSDEEEQGEEDDDDNNDGEEEEEQEEEVKNHEYPSDDMPSKFLLYQQSVQVCAPIFKKCDLFQWG